MEAGKRLVWVMGLVLALAAVLVFVGTAGAEGSSLAIKTDNYEYLLGETIHTTITQPEGATSYDISLYFQGESAGNRHVFYSTHLNATGDPKITTDIPTTNVTLASSSFYVEVVCQLGDGNSTSIRRKIWLRQPAPAFSVSAPGVYAIEDPAEGAGYPVQITIGEEMADETMTSWSFHFNGPSSSKYDLSGDASDFRDTIIIPAANIQAEGLAELYVTMEYSGFRSERKGIDFRVVRPATADMPITITLTEKDGSIPQTILAGRTYLLHAVGDSRIKAMEYYQSGASNSFDHDAGNDLTWEVVFNKGNNGVVVMGTTTDPTEDPTYSKEYKEYYEWGRVQWTAVSEPINVTAVSNGQLDAPEVTLDHDSVLRGESLPVSIGKVSGGRKYTIRVQELNQYEELSIMHFEDTVSADGSGNGSIIYSIPTDHLAAGRYGIQVIVEGEGIDASLSEPVYFTVSGGEATPGTRIIAPATVRAGQEFLIYAYAPGETQLYGWIQPNSWDPYAPSVAKLKDVYNAEGYAIWRTHITDPGEYVIKVYANSTHELLTTTVFQVGPTDGIWFKVSKAEVETCEEFTFMADAPGATSIDLMIGTPEGEYSYVWDSAETDYALFTMSQEDTWGESDFFARIHYPDGSTRDSEVIAVEIKAPKGELQAGMRVNAPVFITPGEPFAITTESKGEEAVVPFSLSAIVMDGRHHRLYTSETVYESTTLTFTVPTAGEDGNPILQNGASYWVNVFASAQGWNGTQYLIPVITGAPEDGATLTINGGETVTLAVGEEYTLVISGLPENTSSVEIGKDSNNSIQWTAVSEAPSAGTLSVLQTADRITDRTRICARYYVNGENGAHYTNEVSFSANCSHPETRENVIWHDGTRYSPIGKKTHECTGHSTRQTICAICGELQSTVEWDFDIWGEEDHHFNNGICLECGYECDHYGMEPIRIEIKDETQHTLTYFEDGKCLNCLKEVPPADEAHVDNDYTDIPHNGVCDMCGYVMEGNWGWYEEGDVLFITGSGAIPDLSAQENRPFAGKHYKQVIISKDITSIGQYIFSGMTGTVRFEMDMETMPEVSQSAFNGTQAICRYYHQWWDYPPATGAQWIYLPVDNRERAGNQLSYDAQGWTFYWNDGEHTELQATRVSAAQAKELTFEDRTINLFSLPTSAEDRNLLEEGGAWLSFHTGCEGDYTVTIPASADPLNRVDLEVDAAGLNLTVEDRRDLSGYDPRVVGIQNVQVTDGALTIKGDARILILRGTEGQHPNLTVEGNVHEINFYDATTGDAAFEGSVTVSGTVEYGTKYGKAFMTVPGLGNVEFGEITTATFTQEAQTATPFSKLIDNGILQGESSAVAPTIDMFRYRYYYHADRNEWDLWLMPKENSPYGSYGTKMISNIRENYNGNFTMNDMAWGDTTELFIDSSSGYSGENVIEVNGLNGTWLKELSVCGAKVKINCPVSELTLQPMNNVESRFDIEINNGVGICRIISSGTDSARLTDCYLYLGPNGSIRDGRWSRMINGTRYFGPISGTQDVFRDDSVCVLNRKEGQQTRAVLTGDNALTDALKDKTGKIACMELSDSNYDALGTKEQEALDGLMTLTQDTTWNVFDVSVKEYAFDGSEVSGNGTTVTELRKPVGIRVENTTGGAAYVVRLHENTDGTVAAQKLTAATDAAVIPFESDLFSKYALVAGTGEIDLSGLDTLTLPADVTRIEANAFEGGAFQAVIIPDGCTEIGSEAFANCTELIYVSYPAGTIIGEGAFDRCNSGLILEPR